MFWIVGGGAIGSALAQLRGGPWLRSLAGQFQHVPWEGLHFHDLIMPLFLFRVGVAMPFSFAKYTGGTGGAAPARELVLRILRRTLLLYLLGIFCCGGFGSHSGVLRYAGVLQRIALCYCAASLLCLLKPRPRVLVTAAAAILLI
jgi:predicted acyltransferase